MSLRSRPIEETVTLPDGRTVVVWVGVPDDPYIARAELDTVTLELRTDGETLATVNTVLDAEDESEARGLAREVGAGLGSGELAPTAGDLEPFADRLG
jgi:hypothetical protein